MDELYLRHCAAFLGHPHDVCGGPFPTTEADMAAFIARGVDDELAALVETGRTLVNRDAEEPDDNDDYVS